MELKNQKLVRLYNDGKQQNLEFSRERRDIYWKRPLPVNKIAPEQDPEGEIGINDKNRINIKVPTLGKYKVFPENHDPWKKQIIDPGSDMYLLWNRVFLCTCILALFVDPLFFYFPSVVNDGNTSCMGTDWNLGIVVTCFRTFADLFYLMNIVIKFRTAYVSPSSRVFGRGELVMDPRMIARRYLRSEFFLDLVAAIPLPQIVIWSIMPAIKSSHSDHTDNILVLIVLLQYIPRLYLIFPLSSQIIKAAGVVTKTAWAGAAYNLLLYMLGSHVSGAAWYLLSIERNAVCLKTLCLQQNDPVQCRLEYLDCSTLNRDDRVNWANSTSVFNGCSSGNATIFNLGIFTPAATNNAFSINFTEKYLYCLWWGLQNLSCYAQTLIPSTYIGETIFAIVIGLLGLILFAHLIGNMQNYLQSLTVRLEEWRLRRRDTEEWMKHRQLPQNLRERVRRFVQYKWVATRGVDEEDILRGLPPDLRRDIQRHLRLDFVRRVPFFSQMDDQLQDAICERLVSSLCTQGTYVYREGDPVTEMLFIIRGRLESSTTDGGRTGFFNSITLNPGDFCGEELLAWALLPKSTHNLPTSTRTVKALVEVEAFALRAEDLKFVANQFRRLHSKKLQHTFRFYSSHWRTWAACFIQAAWRQYKKRKTAKSPSLRELESFNYDKHFKDDDDMEDREEEEQSVVGSSRTSRLNNLGVTMMASMFAANASRGQKLRKPDEPDFSVLPDDD